MGLWNLPLRTAPRDRNGDNDSPPTFLEALFELYDQNIEPLTPMLRDFLTEAVAHYSAARVTEAIKIAVARGPRGYNWRFLESQGQQPQRAVPGLRLR